MIRRLLALSLLIVVGIPAVVTAKLFVFPTSHAPATADAIAVFRGGQGERLDTALRLLHAGVAKHLVIPNGTVPTWPQANAQCRSQPRTVTCPDPAQDSTRGEAEAIASVARQNGWQSIVLVTSTYHVTRARMLLDRCFGGRVDAVKAGPGLTPARYLQRVTHEWAGVAEAVLVNRDC